jgi:hypothetical protein
MEIEYRTHHGLDVRDYVDEESVFSSRHELFFIRSGCNAYLRSGRIIRLPRISAALPEENGIQVRSYFPVMSSAGPVLFTARNEDRLRQQARALQPAATALSFLDARH